MIEREESSMEYSKDIFWEIEIETVYYNNRLLQN